ncbi:MAG: phosphatase PAP2 family protein [Saprospiraceae bacterium]
MLEFLKQVDFAAFHYINGLWRSDAANQYFIFFRTPSNWIPLYLILLFYILYTYKKESWRLILCLIITVSISDSTSSHIIKNTFRRIRPCSEPELAGKVINIVPCGVGYSFTSSHAANHFALAAALSLTLFRRKKYLQVALLFWAGCVAYGQVYCGVHYPFDVLGGALLGLGIAFLLNKFLYIRLLRQR